MMKVKKIRRIIPFLKHNYNMYQNQKREIALNRMTTMDELLKYIHEVNYPSSLLNYDIWKQNRRNIFITLLDYLNFFTPSFDVSGFSCLELGPGTGDALDILQERGAERLEFIDYDPFFYAYNRLKGYKGFQFNYITPPGLETMPDNRYDFIYSKGAFNACRFNKRDKNYVDLPIWLNQIDKLLKKNGVVIFTPTYDHVKSKDFYKQGNLYKSSLTPRISGKNAVFYPCPPNFIEEWFTEIMRLSGYEILPIIEGYADNVFFPLTFMKVKK